MSEFKHFEEGAPFNESFDLIPGKIHVHGFPSTPTKSDHTCTLCGKAMVVIWIDDVEHVRCKRCCDNIIATYGQLSSPQLDYFIRFSKWQQALAISRQPGKFDTILLTFK